MAKSDLIKFLKDKGQERKTKLYEAMEFQIADAKDTQKFFKNYEHTLLDKMARIDKIKNNQDELESLQKLCTEKIAELEVKKVENSQNSIKCEEEIQKTKPEVSQVPKSIN